MNRARWLKGGLVCSLAINLLAVGVLLGRWQAEEPPPPPLIWALQDVDHVSRDRLAGQLLPHAADIHSLRRQLREAGKAMRESGLAEPFDADALRSAMMRFREASMAYQALAHESAVEVLAAMTPGQRRQAVERMMSRKRRPPP